MKKVIKKISKVKSSKVAPVVLSEPTSTPFVESKIINPLGLSVGGNLTVSGAEVHSIVDKLNEVIAYINK